jgi:hypothetical protein
VGEARTQFEEFTHGKKVAAMRARKALQEIKRVAQEARVEIQNQKKGPPAPGTDKPAPPAQA